MVRSRRAFSLVELLVVMAIIGVLAGLAVMSLGTMGAARVTEAGETLRGELDLARTTALAQNRPVAVVFYQLDGTWRGVATFLWDDGTNGWRPSTKARLLPENTEIANAEAQSSLPLSLPSGATDAPPVPRAFDGQVDDSRFFTFRPSGSADLDSSQDWFLTIIPTNAPVTAGDLPDNWAVVQVQPITGMVKLIRP